MTLLPLPGPPVTAMTRLAFPARACSTVCNTKSTANCWLPINRNWGRSRISAAASLNNCLDGPTGELIKRSAAWRPGPEASLDRRKFSIEPLSAAVNRSEEHTSELQSRGHLVCRLLLEKKNKILTPMKLGDKCKL